MKKILSFLLFLGLALNMNAQVVDANPGNRAADPNQTIGKAFQTTGVVSMATGIPCLAAGIGCLLYANLMPDPTRGLTTSQAVANQYADRTYVTTEEYIAKLTDYYGKRDAASAAGYVLTPLGGALTIVGVPLYLQGKKILELNVNYTGNGAGVSVNF